MIAYERLCEALERYQRQLNGEEVPASPPPPPPAFDAAAAVDMAPDDVAHHLGQTPTGFADGDGAPLDGIVEVESADMVVEANEQAYPADAGYIDPAAYEAQQAAYAQQQAAYEAQQAAYAQQQAQAAVDGADPAVYQAQQAAYAQQQAAYAEQQAAYEAQQAAYAQQGGLTMQPTAADIPVDGTPLDGESTMVTTTPVEKTPGEGQG